MNATLARLDRILAMVPWLLANPGAHLDEVAERFETTAGEIAADLDILGYCGVPGYGGGDLIEATVVGDRVHVRMADFFRRPLRLGMREGVTLLLAGRTLLATPGLSDPASLRGAVERLERWLGVAEVAVDLGDADESLLGRLREAAEELRVVRLTYRSTGAERETERDVEAWAVLAAHGSWYLRGFCRAAGAPRDFRLDRIREASGTGQRGAPPPAGAMSTPPRYVPSDDDVEVLLDLDPRAVWLADAVPGAALRDERTLAFPARSMEWAARLVLSLAGDARVLEPASLAEHVRDLVRATRSQYDATGCDRP